MSIHRKMAALLSFSKICQRYISLGKNFPFSQISGVCLYQYASYTLKATKQWQIEVAETFAL